METRQGGVSTESRGSGLAAHQPLILKGVYTFKDGLVFEENDWSYCDEDDRRFYTELLAGIPPIGELMTVHASIICSGRSQLSNTHPAPVLPPNTFDCGDGYLDMATEKIYTYQGEFLRELGVCVLLVIVFDISRER